MPNGGSDCCGTCWFNRSNSRERGAASFNREVPSYREIRQFAIPSTPIAPTTHTIGATGTLYPLGQCTLVTASVCESSGSRRQTARRSVSTCWKS